MTECFHNFECSLTEAEKEAIQTWLNLGYESIREYQRTGTCYGNVAVVEQHLSHALTKAVVCMGTVFRGLSAGNWRPERMDYLRQLLDGPSVWVLPCHDSASELEKIGRGFTYTDSGDEKRHLAILCKIEVKTARYLAPFKHKDRDEGEVVLLKGTRYQRVRKRRLDDPASGLEYWELEWEEII